MPASGSSPTSTVENYLKTLYMLQQHHSDRGLVPLGRLAEALHVTPGTVTVMVKHLAGMGFVSYEPRRGVLLSSAGQKHALKVLRRHRLVELFLVDVMGYDWSEVHDDAEVLEHAVSDKLLEKMDHMLCRPALDPHGDPIPAPSGRLKKRKLMPLSEVECESVTIGRILDHSPGFLHYLDDQHLKPGVELEVISRDAVAEIMKLKLPRQAVTTISFAVAAKILVSLNTKE